MEISILGEDSAPSLAKLRDGSASSISFVFSSLSPLPSVWFWFSFDSAVLVNRVRGVVLGETGDTLFDGEISRSSGESTGDDAGDSVLAYSAFCLPPFAIDSSEI